jgi:hypothetical protein
MEQKLGVPIQNYCFSGTLIFESVMVVIAVGRAGIAAKKMT